MARVDELIAKLRDGTITDAEMDELCDGITEFNKPENQILRGFNARLRLKQIVAGRVSDGRTRYAVICPIHSQVYLTREEYNRQMSYPDSKWVCPICSSECHFDDDNYDRGQI